MSTWWLLNVQLPKSKKIRKREKLMQFGWEGIGAVQKAPQTPEEMKKVFRMIASATKNKKRRKRKREENG